MITVSEEIILGESIQGKEEILVDIKRFEEIFRSEPGCKKFVTSIDVGDPKVLRIYEEWDSKEALSFHFKTQDMAEFQKELGGIKPKAMNSSVYESENALKLEDFH